MKDASTVISDGEKVYINRSGCSALSKGGSGDVLTGMIAAFAATKKNIFEASCMGTYLHGRAGNFASEYLSEYSLLARDIAENISKAIFENL
jgi:NAD(P)H-hydrate epimerase